MAVNVLYPPNFELNLIDQDYIAEQTADDDLFDLLPLETEDAWVLKWRQLDNFRGYQQARAINGEAKKVNPVSVFEYESEPAVYEDFDEITEDVLLKRAKNSSPNEPIDITDLVTEKQYYLTTREYVRLKLNLWTLLQSGSLTVQDSNGQVVWQDTYKFQQFTPTVPWNSLAASGPLGDFRKAVAQAQPGHSVNFGSGARAYMSRLTFNTMMLNTNQNDIGGKKDRYGANYLDLEQFNQVLLANDLPRVTIYDRGYYPDSGSFIRFINEGKVVIIGERPNNQRVGQYVMARNPMNPEMAPGSFLLVADSLDTGKPSPRKITVRKGHAGMPQFFYPNAVLIVNGYTPGS
jgi:hypothetical protein